jgi:hypothetical protein
MYTEARTVLSAVVAVCMYTEARTVLSAVVADCMYTEARTVLSAVVADSFFTVGWCFEIPSYNSIRHVPKCVHNHAENFRLEAFQEFYV